VWGEQESKFKNDGEYHQLLFGTTDESGCIIFHDGWLTPDSPSPLKLDVMTPHHPKWLDGSEPPTDFDSPIPVPFLSVAGRFRVAVSWCGPEDYDKSVSWTEMTFGLLLDALCGPVDPETKQRVSAAAFGIGGKTSSGYGLLIDPEPEKRRRPYSAEALGLPKVDDEIAATLSNAPKSGKPWRATIRLKTKQDLSGPIYGSAPPSLSPGQSIRLIVAEIGERSIKFRWITAPKQ